MAFSRRQFLISASAGIGGAGRLTASGLSGVKIGVTDWNLRLSSKVEALNLAHEIGFAGVEVSLGGEPVEGRLALASPDLRSQYLSTSRQLGVEIAGTCLNILHRNYLKNDKLGQQWLAQAIPATQKLNARVMLLPFFGKGALKTPAELDYIGDILREMAPVAEAAGMILGLENTNSARENLRIMDRSRAENVKVYYDVGNSTRNGYDIYEEMRWLGSRRICQIHLKDNPLYLGEGSIDFGKVMRTISSLDYKGFVNLETNSPSKSIPDDMRRNLAFIRSVIEKTKT
jgi:L-ribulose-5-phosphate 3-epimerase